MDTAAAVTFMAVPAGAVAGIATAVLSEQDSQVAERARPTGPRTGRPA